MLTVNSAIAVAVLHAATPTAATTSGTAESPEHHCVAESERAFDFWLGSWSAEVWARPFGGSPRFRKTADLRSEVVSHVGACLVVEHTGLTELLGDASRTSPGYSARIFDRETGEWRAVLLWPDRSKSAPYAMTGNFRHGRAEFFRSIARPGDDPLLARFTFSDISAQGFRWDAAVASQSWGEVDFDARTAGTWFTESKFEFQRLSANLPAAQTDVSCKETDPLALDGSEGKWKSEDNGEFFVVARIVAGCAWELRLEGGGADPAYVLLAWHTKTGTWQPFVFQPGKLQTDCIMANEAGGLTISCGGRFELSMLKSDAARWTIARAPSLPSPFTQVD